MRYLSDAWLRAGDETIRANAATAPPGRIVVDQHVDELSYRVSIDRDDASLRPFDRAHPPDGTADASFTQDRATAVGVAKGTTDAHQAFLLGHIRFEGDVNLLIERRVAFIWLEQVLAPLVAATTFDDDGPC